ncbi:YgiT-type zinc finger protein [bacterium]|nr:YgiT-type zinc finger protein [bacterium]OIO87847.1 MAG: hypothetical protein AUK02_04560 [Anaerolineae bacterium CG2_30_58_95]PIW18924.1 MAG: hypothetical protein COW33_05260 [Anaerolineae bacterium CG17_big_fil_post_rev_8_21_14_2_50_57_27]
MDEIATKQSYPCNDCQAGVMRLQFITYFTWLSDELITVPNFPAWICDVCGRREYDERAISWLSMLLNPDAGKTATRPRRSRPPLEQRDSDSTRPAVE